MRANDLNFLMFAGWHRCCVIGVQERIVMYQDIFIMVVITGAVSIGALVSMRIAGKKKRRTKLIRNYR